MTSKIALTVCRTQNGFDDAGFASAFERAGFDVVNFDDRVFHWYEVAGYRDRLIRRLIKKRQQALFNQTLQRYLLTSKPRIFFIFKGDAVSSETIKVARKVGAHTVLLYPDLEPKIHGIEFIEMLRNVDRFFHTKPNLDNHFHCTIRSDAEFVYPIIDAAFLQEPSFSTSEEGLLVVAHHSPAKEILIREIAQLSCFRISIFGERWPVFSEPHVQCGGPLFGPITRKLQRQSTAVLGLLTEKLNGFSSGDRITSRSVQVPAYGGLLLHQANEEAAILYGGGDCLFSDAQSLSKLMRHLTHDPDARYAMAVRQHEAVLSKVMTADSFVNKLISDLK